jgi:hypothetical protein
MLGVTEQSESTQVPRAERIARNEAAFRETNEQIDALNAAGAKLPEFPVVCECGSDDCVLVLTVDARKYDEVRAHPDRFLVKSGHEIPDVESVVERHGDFVVVEKHAGAPRQMAQETETRAGAGVVDDEVARRIAENEARFRDANERIEEAVLRLEPDAHTLPFVCECGRPECLTTIRLTIAEYETAREDPRFFVCEPGHEILGPGLGRVVRETSKFVIVEKLGEAGRVAERRDPRSD